MLDPTFQELLKGFEFQILRRDWAEIKPKLIAESELGPERRWACILMYHTASYRDWWLCLLASLLVT
jgi:hypothetical protein